ncbi:putative holin-like toxin [Bacillus sp. RAR_GA_16]|nr:putative holin-like toxin [Bacillus sp. RAR_GA_16]MCA0174073.1 putative holin-like toxin [Bacillus sp. RAR_GA_16]
MLSVFEALSLMVSFSALVLAIIQTKDRSS